MPARRTLLRRRLARAGWAALLCQGRRQVSSSSLWTPQPNQPGLPLRLLSSYIAASLSAYFSRPGSACPVGSGARLPPITSLPGKAAYEAAVARLYASQPPGAWLTPAELFSPAFGTAVAAYIMRHHERDTPPGTPLHIVEVGAGRGTLARDVLSAVRESSGGGNGSGLYARTRYATLDVSPALAAEAAATVRAAGHGGGIFTQAVGDACQGGAWAAVAEKLGGGAATSPYLLLCEVLDNLPHDKVVRNRSRAGDGEDGDGGEAASPAWSQAMVAWAGPGSADRPAEVLRPLTDPVIRECLDAALEEGAEERGGGAATPPPSLSFLARLADAMLGATPAPPLHPSTAGCLFLPTGAARLLEAAAAAFSSHTLLAFDFDALPSTTLPHAACWGAPVVSGPPAPGRPAVDWPDVLAPAFGTADIFFPTDFGLLARLARRAGGGDVQTTVAKSAAWLRSHAPPAALAATTTASGWNPLLDDFVNTAALVVERRGAPPL